MGQFDLTVSCCCEDRWSTWRESALVGGHLTWLGVVLMGAFDDIRGLHEVGGLFR